jgi:S-(hydroxymethyl)glutathione dehydrogenase/alcohol dehydrogenase
VRGAVLAQVGDETLEVRDDIDQPTPGPGEVRVDVAGAGVCHSDLSAMNGTFPQPAPAVLGHEGAGVVSAVGDGVGGLTEGDHVILAWLAPCGDCRWCQGGQPNLCITHLGTSAGTPRFRAGGTDLYAMAGVGCFAEQVVVHASAAVRIDDDVPLDVAALIGCGVTTGAGAVFNAAQVEPGATVAVVGLGGVGLSAVQAARISEAGSIVAIDPLTSKHDLALRLGATHAVTPDDLPGVAAELTGGDGFDYVIEAVGRPATIRAAYDATRRGGATVVVGMGSYTDEVTFNAFELAFVEKRIIGSLYGSADVHRDFPLLIEHWRAGRLDLEGLISRRIPIERINEAIGALAAGEVVRQVVTFG